MKIAFERWRGPALLLLLLWVCAACGESPRTDVTADPRQLDTEQDAAALSSPTAPLLSSATPLATASFMGVEFSFDTAALGPLGESARLPAVPSGSQPAQPERLEIRLSDGTAQPVPRLMIYPVDQFKALSEGAARDIAALQQLLNERPAFFSGSLPLLPMTEAIESFHSQPTYLDFQNGSGIGYLVRADHDHSLATEEVFYYTFQGLTDDGRFYVAAFAPLSEVANGDDAISPVQTAVTPEHQAKPVPIDGWSGIDLEASQYFVDAIVNSLLVMPDDDFPMITLPQFASGSGLIVAYDAAISGAASIGSAPVVVENIRGETEFLHDSPDMVTIDFGQENGPGRAMGQMQIQMLRDEDDLFLEAVPAWQRQEVGAIESAQLENLPPENAVDLLAVTFQNGRGARWFSETDGEAFHYKGVSDSGRFMVRLRHDVPASLSREQAASYLDKVIQSLVVGPDVISGSSTPLNVPGCENNAEFAADVSIPDGTIVDSGETFVKIWRIQNIGTCTWTPDYSVRFAQGNPLEWNETAITAVVPPGEEIEVAVTVESPENPGIYQAWWQVTDSEGAYFGDMLPLHFEAPRPATEVPGYGVIEGSINYPANGNPALDIYFLSVDGSERYAMQTEKGWTHFSNAVPVGTYYVFARVIGDSSGSGGGYTNAVICGLNANCQDHSLAEVVVKEGRATRTIDVFDWYAPEGSFPLPE